MEAHPTVPSKEDRATHSLVGDKIHPDGKGGGWSTMVVELHCHSHLSASVEHLVGAASASRFGCGGSDVGCIGSAGGDH